MTERLQIGRIIAAPLPAGDDVIDIGGGGGATDGQAGNAQRMIAQVHSADGAPATIIAPLGGGAPLLIVGFL